MTTEQKFNQILSILPDNGESIDVTGAPLCEDNNWMEHRLKSLRKEEYFGIGGHYWLLRYRTMPSGCNGSINIYSQYQGDEYAADTEVLWVWLKRRGYFGDKFNDNLF